MARTTWWELEVARLAASARLLEGDDCVVRGEIARNPDSHLSRAGFLSPEALPEILAQVGPLVFPCPACRVAVEIGEHAPGESIRCPACASNFAVPAPEDWTPAPRREATDRHGLLGTIADGIRFDRILFENEFTTVYRAWQVAADRPVAAKCLDAGAVDAEALERLRQEVRLAIDLRHPNLVPILGLVSPRGLSVLVMDYVDGVAVEAILDAGNPMAPARAIAIARPVASALAHLHARGIVHRDVKPGNVFLARGGAVRLGDLDLLERFERLPSSPEWLLGTPQYMSPEILLGAPPSPASDVYALGATLYHLLSGLPPYDGEAPVQVATDVLRAPPRPLGALCPHLPPSIARLVDQLLARRPEARPASGGPLESLLEEADSRLLVQSGA